MMSEKTKSTGKDRPFPWHCIECGEDQIYPRVTDYSTKVKHDGRSYSIRVPDLSLPTCRNCGEQLFTSKADERIVAALRESAGLLTPESIRSHRSEHKLSQQELAEHLGVAKETISRWESGAVIQSRAMDNLVRLYFESEEARKLLANKFKRQPVNRLRCTRVKVEAYAEVQFRPFAHSNN